MARIYGVHLVASIRVEEYPFLSTATLVCQVTTLFFFATFRPDDWPPGSRMVRVLANHKKANPAHARAPAGALVVGWIIDCWQ